MWMILSSLGGLMAPLVLQGFVLCMWHQASWEKASCTSKEGTPYEPSSRHSLERGGTLGTQCLTHTLRGEPSSTLIPFVTPRPHVHDIVLFCRLKALLVPHGFVLPIWHQAFLEKASCTSKEGTLYESGSRHLLKWCGTPGTQCLTHTLRGEPSLTLIPSNTPRPHVHDILLFGWPKGSLSPLKFCSSQVTPSLVGKGLMHIKGGHPLWTRL